MCKELKEFKKVVGGLSKMKVRRASKKEIIKAIKDARGATKYFTRLMDTLVNAKFKEDDQNAEQLVNSILNELTPQIGKMSSVIDKAEKISKRAV